MKRRETWRKRLNKEQRRVSCSAQPCVRAQCFASYPGGRRWGPWAGLHPCTSGSPGQDMPGVCKCFVSVDVVPDIKEECWGNPSTLPESSSCSSYGKFLDCISPSGTHSPRGWPHTLATKAHESRSQSLAQDELCNLPVMTLGQVISLFLNSFPHQ